MFLALQVHGANGSLSGSDSGPHQGEHVSLDLSDAVAARAAVVAPPGGKKRKHVTHSELVQSLSAPYR